MFNNSELVTVQNRVSRSIKCALTIDLKAFLKTELNVNFCQIQEKHKSYMLQLNPQNNTRIWSYTVNVIHCTCNSELAIFVDIAEFVHFFLFYNKNINVCE